MEVKNKEKTDEGPEKSPEEAPVDWMGEEGGWEGPTGAVGQLPDYV